MTAWVERGHGVDCSREPGVPRGYSLGAATSLSEREVIFRCDEKRVMVNAPSLVEAGGMLHCFFFGGEYETAPGGPLLRASRPRRSSEGTLLAWAMETLVDEEGVFQGNSVPLVDGSELWLFFVTGRGGDWASSRVRWLVSVDGGQQWSERQPLDLPEGWLVGTKALRTSWHEVLLPIYSEVGGVCRVLVFEEGQVGDGPKEMSGLIQGDGWLIQPVLAELDGRIIAFLRSDRGMVFRSESIDRARTWSPAMPTELPNPNSRIALERISEELLMMVYNPFSHGTLSFAPGELCRGREILRVAYSVDGGVQWPRDLRRDLVWGTGEYGYPWILAEGSSSALVTYQHSRSAIVLARVHVGVGTVGSDGGSNSYLEERAWLCGF
ncbi:MAG: exo-alpha-sialidase [Acidimicrobiales bacterium]